MSNRFTGKFGLEEYTVCAAVLVLSIGVGLFYGVYKRKLQSKDEYLMGSRQMSATPVALSLMASSHAWEPDGSLLLRNPISPLVVAFIPMTITLLYIYAPVYFKMQLTSSYEYLEIRFSCHVRYLVSVFNMFQTIIYMAFVVYAPSLALHQVTGLDMDLSIAVLFIVCIFYTTIGGFRAVLMTDALQAMIMIGSVLAISTKGFLDESLSSIWDKAVKTKRVEFFRFDPDLRTRHTVWSVVVGGYFIFLSIFAGTQANIQRYSSMPDMKTVRRSILINFLALSTLKIFIFMCGLILIGKYHDCDPYAAKLVTRSDQTIAFLVMDIFADLPIFSGLFFAGIICASLSTVSSGLNAMAAVITEDYVRKLKPNLSDQALLKVSRLVSLIAGLLSFGVVYIVKNMGNIIPVATSINGMVVGPTTGLFTLGIIFPWANSWGALLGVTCSFSFTGMLTMGSAIARINKQLPDQTLSVSTDNCTAYLDEEDFLLLKHVNHSYAPGLDWKERHVGDSFWVKFVSTSYLLYHGVGVVTTVIFGAGFSLIVEWVGLNEDKRVNRDCLNVHCLRFWTWVAPKSVGNTVQIIDLELDAIR